MPESEKQPHRMKAAVILAAGAVLFFLWLFLWSYGAQYWPAFRSLLPPSVYFPIEEFLALNDHNSPWSLIGGPVIAIGFLIWAIRTNNGGKMRLWEKALLGLIVISVLMFLLPCLRAPVETGRRLRCISEMKITYMELFVRYPDRLPDHVQFQNRDGHAVRYLGKGRSWKEPKFILFEDAERCHAGDLRHRIWSDGSVDHFYPWKGGPKF